MIALERAAGTAAHWREQDYRRIFERGGQPRVALVADQPDNLLGFVVASAATHEWEIENVVVASEAKQRGVGSQLVNELIAVARARGAEDIWLEVRESNQAARRLYEKCEFGVAGRRRGYYRDPEEDGLVYSLKLGS